MIVTTAPFLYRIPAGVELLSGQHEVSPTRLTMVVGNMPPFDAGRLRFILSGNVQYAVEEVHTFRPGDDDMMRRYRFASYRMRTNETICRNIDFTCDENLVAATAAAQVLPREEVPFSAHVPTLGGLLDGARHLANRQGWTLSSAFHRLSLDEMRRDDEAWDNAFRTANRIMRLRASLAARRQAVGENTPEFQELGWMLDALDHIADLSPHEFRALNQRLIGQLITPIAWEMTAENRELLRAALGAVESPLPLPLPRDAAVSRDSGGNPERFWDTTPPIAARGTYSFFPISVGTPLSEASQSQILDFANRTARRVREIQSQLRSSFEPDGEAASLNVRLILAAFAEASQENLIWLDEWLVSHNIAPLRWHMTDVTRPIIRQALRGIDSVGNQRANGRHDYDVRAVLETPTPVDSFADAIEALGMTDVVDGNGELAEGAFARLPERVLAEFPNAEIEDRDDDLLATTIGWWVYLPNGYVVSISFGPGTQSDNEKLYSLNDYHLPPELIKPSSEQPLADTTFNAEIQAVNQQREWLLKTPRGFQSLEQTLSFIREVAAKEKSDGRPDQDPPA